MDIQNIISEYFIKPIYERTGYNVINTSVYALLALITIYIVYIWWKSKNIKFDNHFLISILPFILFGSAKRVVTDVVDALNLSGFWKIYEYNIFNVTPGIYVITGILFIALYYLEKTKRLPSYSTFWIGSALAIFHVALLIPFIKNIFPLLYILPMALAGGIATFFIGKKLGFIAGFSQALDGAATFYAIEFLNYGEQHVLSSFIGEKFGYIWFFGIKVLFTMLFAYLLEHEEKDEDKRILGYAIVITAGLAPGIRDLLRILTGV